MKKSGSLYKCGVENMEKSWNFVETSPENPITVVQSIFSSADSRCLVWNAKSTFIYFSFFMIFFMIFMIFLQNQVIFNP